MIVDQRTDKNGGPAQADYRNGAFAITLFSIVWPIFKNILGQWTGKNRGPALADYQNRASAIPLSCIFLPIFKNISKKRNYQIMGVDANTDTDIEK
jgi:hypothetical protein